MVDNKFLPKLSQNLLEILNDDEYYDITIEVGKDPYVKVFRAHMMDEIQIWERVIKWGVAQNPALPSELTNYSKDDFKTLKNSLQQCIPFIRFYNLTSKEFKDKVLPYRKLLPKELYEDLLDTFLKLSDPDSRPTNKSKPRIYKHKQIDVEQIQEQIPYDDIKELEAEQIQEQIQYNNDINPEQIQCKQS
ncbi:hypothetical protein C1645_810027 [Glomus cerebriforme]|uniref:BACK domain-containing protein n=1 Tax=Glomus cerebriforme TaxID=658196 RepID=A0A397S9U7_9GLOM|nr:hypothetical protein C1645_810027 [Glomus cerebriforme]